MGTQVRGTWPIAVLNISIFVSHPMQEAQEKYRASKAELDELVSNMEGL